MSQEKVKRAQILDLLKERKINQKEALQRLKVSPRQVRRLTKRYQACGLAALISKKRGCTSNRRLDAATRTTTVELIGTYYRDFGPTLAQEKLAELHNLHLSVESTRQIMIDAGLLATPARQHGVRPPDAGAPPPLRRDDPDRRQPARLV